MGLVALNFQDICIRVFSEGKEIEFIGIQGKPIRVISSNSVKKLIKKGHQSVVTKLFSLCVQTFMSSALVYLQKFINDHAKVFG